MARKPVAVIDVGSNSVRLVVYGGGSRVPSPIFNEKVLAGLGAGLAETGAITRQSGERALAALRRFKLIVDHIGAARTQVLATAAVRDASNGAEFARKIRSLGLPCRTVSAEEEASLAGLGIISAIPGAKGIVGDVGGGSLEMVEVRDGRTSNPISLPLGVLRIGDDQKAARRMIRSAVEKSGWSAGPSGDFYMVGGSWRALARIDMIVRDFPLPVLQQYEMAPERAGELCELVRTPDPKWREAIAGARLESSPVAAMLLSSIVEELKPQRLVTSTFGIREGLLFSSMAVRQRRDDPLVSAVRELSIAEGPTEAHGDSLEQWLSGAFEDSPELARLRLSACLLASASWRAIPSFRADRSVELALHGNWVGIDSQGRVLIAQALSCAFGSGKLPDNKLVELCLPRELQRARQWGLAIRAGQRLSGGVESILQQTRLECGAGRLVLRIPRREADLANDGVLRRLTRLADDMGVKAAVEPL